MSKERRTAQISIDIRRDSPEAPRGWRVLAWYGPGLLWMISSVGSGSILFTPRVGGRYGYSLLWMLILVVFLMWVMIREVGRYTVVSGRTILDGYRDLSGSWNWAIWLIALPQVIAAVTVIAGISALLASVLVNAFSGSHALYAIAAIILACALVISGKYKIVERTTSFMAMMLTGCAIAAALAVSPDPAELSRGIRPAVPANLDYYFILPWLGFILAGAAGIMWFSYWVGARGYGGPLEDRQEEKLDNDPSSNCRISEQGPDDEAKIQRLKRWINIMSTSAGLGVLAGGLTIVSFLVLGTELLMPEGIIPEGVDVAKDLTRLLSEIWGSTGFWILTLSMSIALWGTILSDTDGWARMLADATIMLFRRSQAWNRHWLEAAYIIIVVMIIPILVFWLVREPVSILSVGGSVAAAHTPIVVFLTLYLNRKRLPRPLRPGLFCTTMMTVAGLFYGGFAFLHFLELIGIRLL